MSGDSGGQSNSLLMMYLAAAREEAEKFLNRTLYDETVSEQDTTGLVITPLIKLRLMQLVGYWYENREMQDAVPDFFYTGLRMYRFHPGT
ncbi:head-tail connector protein [Escherichia coli]|uniref:head-tail connector protein n=1 Tax=Escherichia coli TaxID=562 RepID=UPI003B27D139